MNEQNLTTNNITIEAMQAEKQGGVSKAEPAFNEKNYLNVRLKKGEKKREIYIRLLPIDANSNTPFCRIRTHNAKVPKEVSESGYKNYICLSNANEILSSIDGVEYGKCPFCELNKKAYQMAQEETDPIKKRDYIRISKANHYKDTYIIRCIERGAETDGPKFYKFNAHKDGSDVYHKIMALYEMRYEESVREGDEPENILDLYKGKDLKLTITATEDDENRTNVDVMDCGKNKPLSNDPSQITEWVNNPKKWSDVFTIKPYGYLDVILKGKVPFYDKENKTWVEKANNGEPRNPNAFDDKIKEAEAMCVSASTISYAEQYANDMELPF